MLTVFGIKQCDTVKKSRKWLQDNKIEHHFHDVRTDGLDAQMIQRWCNALGWESVVNKRSTTWRGLDEESKNGLNSHNVIALLLAHPTLIKRPIVEGDQTILLGFKPADFEATFK